MKWLAVALLGINLAYFGWEFNNRVKSSALQVATASPGDVPRGERLRMVQELDRTPELRSLPNETGDENTANLSSPERIEPSSSNIGKVMQAEGSPNGLPDCVIQVDEKDRQASLLNQVCRTIGPFLTKQSLAKARRSLTNAAADIGSREGRCKQRQDGFWVYQGPFASQELIKQNVKELKKKGLDDYYVIPRGPLEKAISLGFYTRIESAEKRSAELKALGIATDVSPNYDVIPAYWMDVKLRDADTSLKLPKGVAAAPIACKQVTAASSKT